MATAIIARDNGLYLVDGARYVAADCGLSDDGRPYWTLEPEGRVEEGNIAYYLDPETLAVTGPEGQRYPHAAEDTGETWGLVRCGCGPINGVDGGCERSAPNEALVVAWYVDEWQRDEMLRLNHSAHDRWPGTRKYQVTAECADEVLSAEDPRWVCVQGCAHERDAMCRECFADIGASASGPSAAPGIYDDTAWAELAEIHREGCWWINTRAYRCRCEVARCPIHDEDEDDDAEYVAQ